MLPTIYYICYLPPKTGGELVNFQHVATLNRMGWRAVCLVNPTDSVHVQRLTELLEGAVVPLEQLQPGRVFQASDVIVIPEFYKDAFKHFATQPCRRVIHLQGPFLAFRGFDSIDAMNSNGLMGGLTCSSFAKHLLQKMGSTIQWNVITPFLHPLFGQRKLPKKLQIAYMPDKRPKEAPVVYSLFRHHYPQYKHIPWVPITGMSRAQCAEVMAESAIFASLSYLEGLGLPPLEAMASGCVVCGFDGHGGTDFANDTNGIWVKEGDHLGFAHALAKAVQLYEAAGDQLVDYVEAGKNSAVMYSKTRFDQELVDGWDSLLGDQTQRYKLASS